MHQLRRNFTKKEYTPQSLSSLMKLFARWWSCPSRRELAITSSIYTSVRLPIVQSCPFHRLHNMMGNSITDACDCRRVGDKLAKDRVGVTRGFIPFRESIDEVDASKFGRP